MMSPIPQYLDSARESELAALLSRFDTPHWLRRAAAEAMDRDPVIAASCLEVLAATFGSRADCINRTALAALATHRAAVTRT